LWSIGIYDLHLANAEFWRLTLAQLDGLLKRYQNEQERQDYRTAMICASLYNTAAFLKHDKVCQPKDFMPQSSNRKQSPEEMTAKIKMINAILGD